MIPRIIHYCWFGGKPMPELAVKCIESWKKYLPEYELRLWNEETFDLDMYPYAREAYDNRKFAFVTDVVRLWALEKFGGVYMDTDVEILRPIGELMDLPAFTGYEASMANAPVTGLMASAPHGVWVREQLAYYEGRHFVLPDGTLDMTTNTVTIARIMQEGGFVINGKYQVYKNDMHVFPVDYFCPLTSTRVLKLTKNTYCIHHFAGSWIEKTRGQLIKEWIVEHIIGHKLTDMIVQFKRGLATISRDSYPSKIEYINEFPNNNNHIPHTIHYCWFGETQLPELEQRCLASWHKYMSDWEYMRWDESNFDITVAPLYVRQAYEARKFAFVSDYVRLWALEQYGGLYMDVDFEVYRSFDELMDRYPAFAGYEGSKRQPVMQEVIASEPHGAWVRDMLSTYDNRVFIKDDGSFDLTPNTLFFTDRLEAQGFVADGVEKDFYVEETAADRLSLNDKRFFLHVFPVHYFCPVLTTGEDVRTQETYCEHLGESSWAVKGGRKAHLLSMVSPTMRTKLIKLKRKMFG